MQIQKILLGLLLSIATVLITGCWETQSTPQIAGPDINIKPTPQYNIPDKTYTFPVRPCPVYSDPLCGRTIIVDAGHGGKDPGALARWAGSDEKIIVLDIAKKLASELKSRGANVIMTRQNDTFIELDDRAACADRNHADLLVSIHADSHENPNIGGVTIYISRNPLPASRIVAEEIEAKVNDAQIQTRGIRSQDFRVLAKHSRPAVLVETGYITNSFDSTRLNNSWYRKKIATAIADGIEKAMK